MWGNSHNLDIKGIKDKNITMEKIKKLQIGEIIKIGDIEYLLYAHPIGGSFKTKPQIKLLSPLLEKINRKSYFKFKYKREQSKKEIIKLYGEEFCKNL